MKLRNGGLAVLFALRLAFDGACVVAGDDDDDSDSQGEGSGPSTQGETENSSETQTGETQNGETQAPTTDPTDDTADTGSPEDSGDPPETSDTGQSSDSAEESDSGGGISPECNALCARTPIAQDAEADCVAAVFNEFGGHTLQEASCMAFTEAFDEGTATVQMCEQCYLDAGVAADLCATAEDMCFLFP